MSSEVPDFVDWLPDAQPVFEDAQRTAKGIGTQNDLHNTLVESDTLTIQSFQEAASNHLKRQQQADFDTLSNEETLMYYDELADKDRQLRAEIGLLTTKGAELAGQQLEQSKTILMERDIILDKLPELSDELTSLASQMQDELLRESRLEVEQQLSSLAEQANQIDAIYETAGTAWPIPRLIETKTYDEADEELVEIDSFPDSTKRDNDRIAEQVKRNHPDEVLHDASEFIALLLAEEPEHVFSLEDLGDILYGRGEENRKPRISALISNFELGKIDIIGQKLYEFDLVFQRGVRSMHSVQSGARIGAGTPVFRAVFTDDEARSERIVHSDQDIQWVDDQWKDVKYEPVVIQAPPVAESPATGRVSRREKNEPEWKLKLRQDLEESIIRFDLDGLMQPGYVSRVTAGRKHSSSSMATDEMMDRAVRNNIISRSEINNDLPLFKYVLMAIQNKQSEIYGNRSRRKQALSMAEKAVDRHFADKNLYKALQDKDRSGRMTHDERNHLYQLKQKFSYLEQ